MMGRVYLPIVTPLYETKLDDTMTFQGSKFFTFYYTTAAADGFMHLAITTVGNSYGTCSIEVVRNNVSLIHSGMGVEGNRNTGTSLTVMVPVKINDKILIKIRNSADQSSNEIFAVTDFGELSFYIERHDG